LAGGHALSPARGPDWLATEEALGACGYSDTASGRRKWVERLDRRAIDEEAERSGLVLQPEEADARFSHLRRGWYWGSQEFAERMLKLAKAALGRNRSRSYRGSPVRKAHDATLAEALLVEGLQAAELSDDDLLRLPGSEPRKVAIAPVIWERTTVPQSWLAEKLMISSPANVSQQLRRGDLSKNRTSLPRKLREWLAAVNK
jgi:hypothetical protein